MSAQRGNFHLAGHLRTGGQLALNDSLAFALTGDNATASFQLDEPTWPLILLMVWETEPEEADDDVTRGTL